MTGHRPWRELRAQLVERVGEEKLAEGAARVREEYDAAQADVTGGIGFELDTETGSASAGAPEAAEPCTRDCKREAR